VSKQDRRVHAQQHIPHDPMTVIVAHLTTQSTSWRPCTALLAPANAKPTMPMTSRTPNRLVGNSSPIRLRADHTLVEDKTGSCAGLVNTSIARNRVTVSTAAGGAPAFRMWSRSSASGASWYSSR
jgi:hypothetical protein